MDLVVLNVRQESPRSLLLYCKPEPGGRVVLVELANVPNEYLALPNGRAACDRSALEEEALAVLGHAMVPICRAQPALKTTAKTAWVKRGVCFYQEEVGDARCAELRRESPLLEEEFLSFYVPFSGKKGEVSLSRARAVLPSFETMAEAFLVLYKIKGVTKIRVRACAEGKDRVFIDSPAEIQNLGTAPLPALNVCVMFFHLAGEEVAGVSSIVYKKDKGGQSDARTESGCGQNLSGAQGSQDMQDSSPDGLLRPPAHPDHIARFSAVCGSFSPQMQTTLAGAGVSVLDGEGVLSYVKRKLAEAEADLVITHNFALNKRAEFYGSPHRFSKRLEAALFCDLCRFVPSVKRLQDFSLAEMSSAFCAKTGASRMDAAPRGKAGAEAAAAQRDRYGVDMCVRMTDANVVGVLNEVQFSACQMEQVVKGGRIVELVEQLANVSGGTISSTLSGFNSDRVEHLLLHRFREENIVSPPRARAWKIRSDAGAGREEAEGYKGGHVFLEAPGKYDEDYTLLFDFNSLYPSIIMEYNVCFRTLLRSGGASAFLPADTSSACEGARGVLPKIVEELVERRREIKGRMSGGAEGRHLLDIEQNAVKLVANCIYGCLGFRGFRFYNRDMAAFVTERGRSILQRTKSRLERRGYKVIYGDTDSVMVRSGLPVKSLEKEDTLFALRSLKTQIDEIAAFIGKEYRHVRLGMDKMFPVVVMVAKKKYFGCYALEDGAVCVEEKGMESGKRDCPELAGRAISEVIRHLLFSGAKRSERIFEVFATLKDRIACLPREAFVIRRVLKKSPDLYTGTQALPHVSLALRLREERGIVLHAGEIVPYVIGHILGAAGSEAAAHDRARAILHDPHLLACHPGEDVRANVPYYIKAQLLPPVARVLALFPDLVGTGHDVLGKIHALFGIPYTRPSQARPPGAHHGQARGSGDSAPSPRSLRKHIDLEDDLARDPRMKVTTACCASLQTVSLACDVCRRPLGPKTLLAETARIIAAYTSDLYKSQRKCHRCGFRAEFVGVCILCNGCMDWEVLCSPLFFDAVLSFFLKSFSTIPQVTSHVLRISNASMYRRVDLSKWECGGEEDLLFTEKRRLMSRPGAIDGLLP